MDDNAGTERWLTYDELAALRGIKRIGAVRLVQRHKWRRQAGNDGLARVLVPPDALEPVRRTDAGTSAPANGALTSAGTTSPTNAGTSADDIGVQLAALMARADRAEERADEANKRADVAVALADRTLAQLAEASTEMEKLRDRLDAAEIRTREAETAVAELRQAEAELRARGVLARLRAAWRGE
jgi:hypothetical protein